MKVAIYVRLSREDEVKTKDESESIVNQKSMLISYAQDKGWDIHNIYTDEDYSGSDVTRPAFNEMLRDAEKGEFQILLCKSLSRFARDVALVETYINGKFLDWGIRFISPTDYADNQIKGSKKGIQINSLVNQWYLEDLSENIRSVLKHKKEQGQFLSALPPYGYKKDPANKHKLIKDDNVSNVVEIIFNLAISEHTTMSIVHHLNNIGYINPSTYFIEQGLAKQIKASHTRWGSSTIKRILHNQVYAGDLVLNVSGKKTYKSERATKRPKEEWIIHKDTHEPYISYLQFEKIQNMLSSRSGFYTAHKGGVPNHYKGLIFCNECGGVMTVTRDKKKGNASIFYRCARAERGVTMCKGTRISQSWLDRVISDEIRKAFNLVLNNTAVLEIKANATHNNDINVNINALKKRLESLNNSLALSFVEKAEGKMTQEEYSIVRNGITQNIENLKLQLERDEKILSEIKLQETDFKNITEFVEKHKDFTEISREIIVAFVKKITVNKRKSQKIFDYDVDIELKI